MKPEPITEPVYLRFGKNEHHIGDLAIPYAVIANRGEATATLAVDTAAIPAQLAALLRAAADRIEAKDGPDAAA